MHFAYFRIKTKKKKIVFSSLCLFSNKKKIKLESQHFLSLIDEEFVYNVDTDIREFIKRRPKNTVLLFPPVNNYRRFLIHKTCENLKNEFNNDLITFSIGQGYNRRTVICFKTQILIPIETLSSSSDKRKNKEIKNWRSECLVEPIRKQSTNTSALSSVKMGVEKTGTNRINKTGSIDLYRPPALRKIDALNERNEKFTPKKTKTRINSESSDHKEEDHHQISTTTTETGTATTLNEGIESTNSNSNATVNRPIRKERRPDRAVYIPRARRNLTNSIQQQVNNCTTAESTQNISSSYTNHTIIENRSNDKQLTNTKKNSKSSSSPSASSSSTKSFPNSTTSDNAAIIKEDSRRLLYQSSVISNNCCDKIESLPLQSEPPSSEPSLTTSTNHIDTTTTTTTANTNCISSSQEFNSFSIISKESEEEEDDGNDNEGRRSDLLDNLTTLNLTTNCDNNTSTEIDSYQSEIYNTNNSIDTVDSCMQSNHLNNMFSSRSTTEQYNNIENNALRIEDMLRSGNHKNDKDNKEEDKEIKELQRASKEINRSNRCIIKQTFNSDILEIPEPNEITLSNKLKSSLNNDDSNDGDDGNKSKLIRDVDPENDDWDSMFDDNGECIDPKILSELTASVGKVKIETPQNDYKAYHIKQSILNDEEFPHVLEVSNFPVEFKTQDLMMIFSAYKESGFDIKWVDDTHALAIFSSSRIAAEVLAMGHPFVLLKPLAEATIESRAKAKKCSSSLQPYRPRPETCAALARRLVTGALGVRLKTHAQERENEKRVLREAKERKLLAAKQRDEAWES